MDGLVEGKVLRRTNRFTLEVEVRGRVEKANLRDSGRLPELVKAGNRALLKPKSGGKTSYTVFILFDRKTPVFVNSSFHSLLAEKILKSEGYEILGKEVKVNGSRIDFLAEKSGEKKLVEVKGCTLVRNSVALFPDAPTERGLKHVKILEKYGGELLFLIMRDDAEIFSPNYETHEEFAVTLERARERILVRAAKLKPDVNGDELELKFLGYVPVAFKKVI